MKNFLKKSVCLLLALIFVMSLAAGVFADDSAEKSQYKVVEDLDGKNIGVQTSVLYETNIYPSRVPNATIQYYTMPNDMILALNAHKIDGYLIEEVGYYAQAANHPELTTMDDEIGTCAATIVIGNNDKQERLLSEVNQFIADHGPDGDGMLDEMYDYWIKNFDADTSVIQEGEFTGENGEIVVGVEGGYEPFSFIRDGEDCGYDVDFVCRFCREYGYIPKFENVPFESIAPAAEVGKYDLGMNIILSDERDDAAVLSDVYYECPIVMVVLDETADTNVIATGGHGNSQYQVVEDFDGKNIGVQTSVLYETNIYPSRVPNATIQYYTMPNDMILALNAHKIEGYLIEEVGYYAQTVNHPELTTLDDEIGTCAATIVIGNNDKQERLLSEVNQFIADHGPDGDGMLDEMYDYWIKNFDANTSTIQEGEFTGENGEIVVGVEGGYEPFSFIRDGEDCGYDVDFVCRFCREYGYTPRFENVPFESIAPAAEVGKYDLGMNIILSDERDDAAVLSDVYYECPIVMVVLADDEEAAATGFWAKMQNNFYITFIKENRWELFAEGAWTTIVITFCSIAFGTILGFAVFLACRRGNKIANKISDAVMWVIDGMPTVVLLMILYYIVFGSTRLTGTFVSIVGFTLIFACSMFDMLKVGFGAVGRGQYEASKALGYSENEAFFKVLLPQAARHFLPIYKNELVMLIKETSVAGYIAVHDLTKISDLVRSRTYQAFFALIFTAIMYYVLEWLFTTIVDQVEKALDPKRRSKEKILKGIKEQE